MDALRSLFSSATSLPGFWKPFPIYDTQSIPPQLSPTPFRIPWLRSIVSTGATRGSPIDDRTLSRTFLPTPAFFHLRTYIFFESRRHYIMKAGRIAPTYPTHSLLTLIRAPPPSPPPSPKINWRMSFYHTPIIVLLSYICLQIISFVIPELFPYFLPVGVYHRAFFLGQFFDFFAFWSSARQPFLSPWNMRFGRPLLYPFRAAGGCARFVQI